MAQLRLLADWDIPEREQTVLDNYPADVEIIEGGTRLTDEEKLDLAPTIDVLAGRMNVVKADFLRAATNLKLVHMTGHGVDKLVRDGIPDLLQRRGIALATADSAAIPIAEWAIMTMIALSRNVIRIHNALALQGEWRPVRGPELAGSTLCVVGLGSIGEVIVRRARAMDMTVGAVTYRPERHADRDDLEFTLSFEQIDDALAQANYVVLALPLTAASTALIDAARLAAMKPGSYLINIGRGPLVVEAALAHALSTGLLAGAAIDGWWCEENGPREGYPSQYPLHQYNVLMSPHYCGSTFEIRTRALSVIGENVGRLLHGEPLLNQVTPDDLAAMGA
jgi:phosphoglycerate dehydrogenase-like enzyme